MLTLPLRRLVAWCMGDGNCRHFADILADTERYEVVSSGQVGLALDTKWAQMTPDGIGWDPLRRTQKPLGVKSRVGSTPTFGTTLAA